MGVCVWAYVYVCMSLYMHACLYGHVCVHVFWCFFKKYTCMTVYASAYINVYMLMYINVCMCVCICVYMDGFISLKLMHYSSS